MSIVVVYHKGCMDGFGAALVAWKKFGAQASYIPVSYGTEQDSFVDDMAKSAGHPLSELYVLDFSFNTAQVRRLAKIFERITILDHHDTARKELMEERQTDKQRGASVGLLSGKSRILGMSPWISTWIGLAASWHGIIFSNPSRQSIARFLDPSSSTI
jgi:hypothetical protein